MGSREVIQVSVGQLAADPSQPRTEFAEESLLGLAASLKHGQLQPILAYQKDGKLLILDGERRWRAAKRAGLATVDVIIVDEPAEAGFVLQRQLVANLQREDLAPMERARAIDRLIKATGSPAARVAQALGLSSGNVSRTLALLGLPESVQAQVESGDLKASAAYQIARSGDASTQEQLAAEVAGGRVTRDALAGRLRAKKSAAGKAATRGPVRLKAVLGGGRSITLSGAGLDSLDRLIEWLEELLGRARKFRPRGLELATFAALLRDEANAAGGGA